MTANNIKYIKHLQLHLKNKALSHAEVRNYSSNTNWKRTNIEDYTCEWSFPIRTLLGKGRRNEVINELRSNQNTSRPLIVTDKSVYNLPITQKWLEEIGRHVEDGAITVFSEVHPNPIIEDVLKGSDLLQQKRCDCVIGIGGGSALDAAKSIAMYAKSKVDDVRKFDFWLDTAVQLPDGGHFVPVITMPTTSGTGAEMGSGSMLTDLQKNEKMCVGHPNLSVTAILDPELTMDLPPNITAWTGMDAVTHAMEALLVPPVPKNLPPTGFHPLCDGAALQALRAINNNIERAVKHGKEDIVSRAEMQVAAALAGVSFQKGLGAVHGLSEPIGATFNTQHGLTNAVILPWVLKDLQTMSSSNNEGDRIIEWKNANQVVESTCQQVVDCLSLNKDQMSNTTALTKVINWVEEMNSKLGIPERLRDIIPENKNNDTDTLVENKYHFLDGNMECLTDEQLLDMSLKAERNDTGFTNFIRFDHEDYLRVLKKCF